MGNGFESHPLKWKRPLAKRTEKYNYSWKSFALFCVIKYVAPFVNLPTDFSLIAICYLLIHVIKCGIITMNWIKVHSLFQDKTLVAPHHGRFTFVRKAGLFGKIGNVAKVKEKYVLVKGVLCYVMKKSNSDCFENLY